MKRPRLAVVAVVFFLFMKGMAFAQQTIINNPGGGKIAFGRVDGQTTEAGAMAAVLHSIHAQFNDRPQVGKLFQVKGTQSIAAFFSVYKKNQDNTQRAGLLIVTKVSTDEVQAATVSDDASHFGTSFQPMMKTLFSQWRPFAAAQAGSGKGPGAPAAALERHELPDHSASVELPAGWKILANSGMGTIIAEGPAGESAALGFTLLVNDLNNPQVRQTYNVVRQGGLRNTAYAKELYYPAGGDLAKTMVDLQQIARSMQGLAPIVIQVENQSPVASTPGQRCVHSTGHMDIKDGKGMNEMNAVFCTTTPRPGGTYLAGYFRTLVPNALADKERATMGAILASFNVNQAIVQRQANALAAPLIEQIHAIGRAAANQAAAAQQRNAIQNSSVYQHWDDMDKRSKEFSNYQLGYSVVHDIPNNAHGTFWNADADALVRHDPQRFEYVNAPNFWKGIDY